MRKTGKSLELQLSDVSPEQERRATVIAVESPYGNGTDRVHCVDAITAMMRQRKLPPLDELAAFHYRDAYLAVYESGHSPIIIDVVDTSSSPDPITARRMSGARVLSEAQQILGPLEPWLRQVVAGTTSLEEFGRHFGERDQRRAKAAGSVMLRFAFRTLANGWGG